MAHQRCRVVDLPGGRRADLVVDRHDEGEGVGVVLDDEDRPRRFIAAVGENPRVAIDRVRRVRPGAIETPVQEAHVLACVATPRPGR